MNEIVGSLPYQPPPAANEPPRPGTFPASVAFDEAFLPNGTPRPQLSEFWRALEELGPLELERRREQAVRLIRQNGVTYNVYGDPRGMDRPWEVDPVPLVIGAEEWETVARGLSQRAHLLDLVLRDIYGPQELLREGLLPPEVVLQAEHFLRPLHGHRPPGDVYLHLVGVDLARSPDGTFWVLGDRTQAPSGAGYALENRIVTSRLWPQLFRDCRVERLAEFFASLRESLAALTRTSDQPRVVLLTPGPYNETYFEHAYLARYLGYALVEGGDLTVRDGHVYLKTLGGLEKIDLVLRRLDDAYCDPLSLRSDSTLGIAGLVRAARQGNVTIANALGSGVIETPAMLAFLPLLCRRLLDEELLIPSVATWWCGHEAALAYVRDHLGELVIRSAFASTTSTTPISGATLSNQERDELLSRIERNPTAYVAQEQVALSTAPVWTGAGMEPRHVSLRTFLARTGDHYSIMPGGLVRVSDERDSLLVSMQRGGTSKDAWVRASGTPGSLTLLQGLDAAVPIVRGGADLPSRSADNLFWLGRHMERAENLARLMRGIVWHLTDEVATGHGPKLLLHLATLEANVDLLPGALSGENVALKPSLLGFIANPAAPNTLLATIDSAFRAGSVARDRISKDTWRVISRTRDLVRTFESLIELDLQDAFETLDDLVLSFSAYEGLCQENSVHGPGFRFADIGRRIERALFGLRLIRSTLLSGNDANTFDTVLDLADSSITYRARYGGRSAFAPVLDLLLHDETNPRSVGFQLLALEKHCRKLPRGITAGALSPSGRVAYGALGELRLAELNALSAIDATGEREALARLIQSLDQRLYALGEQITHSYLTHVEASIALGTAVEGLVGGSVNEDV